MPMCRNKIYRAVLGLVCLSCLLLSACSSTQTPEVVVSEPLPLEAGSPLPADQTVYRRSVGGLTMEWNNDTAELSILNETDGYRWSSAVDFERYAITTNQSWTAYMHSLFAFTYTDLDLNKGAAVKAYSANEPASLSVEQIDGGLRLQYHFTKLSLHIAVELRLDEEGLSVAIPAAGLQEEGQYGLVSIELLPFLGAADHTVDGYIVFPDGSGALMNYADYENRPANVKTYRLPVYAPETVSFETVSNSLTASQTAMLPVFGIKNGSDGLLAYAVKGEADSHINLSPEGASVAINRCAFEFRYRESFEVETASSYMTENTNEDPVYRYEAQPRRIDREVRYAFSSGNVSYSTLAVQYRTILENRGLLCRVEENPPVLGLDIFQGIREKGFLVDGFCSMTTFEQALQMAQDLQDSGVSSVRFNLIGWSQGGYGRTPDSRKPESQLGGGRGLDKLYQYTSEQGIPLSLQLNLPVALKETGGFSVRRDAVVNGGDIVVTDADEAWFLLTPQAIRSQYDSFLKKNQGWYDGLTFEKAGQLAYSTYGQESGRQTYVEYWQDIWQDMKDMGRSVAVQGGNQYALAWASWLCDIPQSDSGNVLADESVPFFQMVVSGSIPYTGEAGNEAYDLDIQRLKWVEYGYVPYFEITWDDPLLLKDTAYNQLFSSQYADWKSTIESVYEEFAVTLKPIVGQKMQTHEKLAPEVYRVTYENGAAVLINYTDSDVQAGDVTIPAKSYRIVEG